MEIENSLEKNTNFIPTSESFHFKHLLQIHKFIYLNFDRILLWLYQCEQQDLIPELLNLMLQMGVPSDLKVN